MTSATGDNDHGTTLAPSFVPAPRAGEPAADLPLRSVAVVLGTRPELIKLSPLLRLLGPAAYLVHTGQHYEPVLAFGVLRGVPLPQPDIQLDVGGRARGEQIGVAVTRLTQYWSATPPRLVIVHGDTNATLAGALAANGLGLPLVHVEAGLRSFDRRMPEEHNRVLADHLADLCCAPTPGNVANLRAEAIPPDRVALTGNTIVEAVTGIERDWRGARRLLAACGIDGGEDRFILATLHRPENVDEPGRLRCVLAQLADLSVPVLLVLHPRTRHRIRRFGLAPLLRRIHATGPLAYPTFLGLAEQATLLISDSGGIQEEASVLKKPLLVIRRSTERPEALGTFATLVTEPESLHEEAERKVNTPSVDLKTLPTPFGDGHASKRIFEAITAMARTRTELKLA